MITSVANSDERKAQKATHYLSVFQKDKVLCSFRDMGRCFSFVWEHGYLECGVSSGFSG